MSSISSQSKQTIDEDYSMKTIVTNTLPNMKPTYIPELIFSVTSSKYNSSRTKFIEQQVNTWNQNRNTERDTVNQPITITEKKAYNH